MAFGWGSICLVLAMIAFRSSALVQQRDLFQPNARFPCFRQPVIVTAGSNRKTVLAFAENRNVSACAPAMAKIGSRENHPEEVGSLQLRRSEDGGVTWGPMVSLFVGDIDFYTATVDVDGATVIVVLQAPVGNVVLTSKDTGQSWTEAPHSLQVDLPEPFKTMKPSVGHGIVIDPTLCAGGECEYAGRMVIPMICFNGSSSRTLEGDKGACPTCHSCYIYTDDKGITWKFGASLASGSREATIAQISSSTKYPTLYVNARNMGATPGHRLQSTCSMGGPSDGCSSTSVNGFLPSPVTAHWTGIVDNIVRNSGTLYLSGASDPIVRANLTLWSSQDSKSWSVEQVLWDGPAGYSDIASVGAGEDILVLCENGNSTFADRVSLFTVGV